MTRTTRAATALAATLVLLTACGSDTADDPTPESAPSTAATPSGAPTPTLEPGSYPDYPHQDYTYVLRLECYCPSAGQPIAVTVADGEVTSAVWATDGQGGAKGEEVGFEWAELTLDDIIAEANDTESDVVEVDWADGADHPTRVSVDRDKRAVDEEISYLVSDVEVSP